MKQISEIFIKSFKCLNCFSLDLNKKCVSDSTCNINLLIGKNGAGKSTFLDALYEIAINTKNPDKIFRHYLKDFDGEIICGNCSPENHENIEEKSLKNDLWKKVIRFYTGNSNRNIEYTNKITSDYMSFARDEVKFVLSALFLSGAWNNAENKEVIKDFKNIIFGEGITIEPYQMWIDVANYDKDSFEIKNDKWISRDIKGLTRLYIKIPDIKDTQSSFSILNTLLNAHYAETNDKGVLITPNTIIDTGFLYKKENCNGNDNLYIDESLSDGELGLIRRFSLILLMKELKGKENRSLLLMDEPETHFNENWKRHFIYLINETLKDTYHDVFIATHSAMLITDVKRDELYRFEFVNDKIKSYPVSINTYGANVIDIGQALFDLEADIGERSKKEIEKAINNEDKTTLKKLLKQVGPGEWRWRIRTKLNEIQKYSNRNK